jgi:uncharacterized protein YacL
METTQLVIIAVLLVLLAEVTYVLAKLPHNAMKRQGKKLILVDTSVLIDSRIIAVAKSGFVTETLAIPRSVVGELQYLADTADHEKRARARHGLDVINELQQMPHVKVQILQDSTTVKEGVDERLLILAKKYNASVCTVDYNLNKVAVVEGIRVLNINELAQSLRMAYLPGERTLLALTQKGQDSHQAVGHLPDGTMVVVENAASKIGGSVEIEFIRSLQTAAGKMMFAKMVEQAAKPQSAPVKQSQPTATQQKRANRSSGTKPQTRTSTRNEPVSERSPSRQAHTSRDTRRTHKRVDHESNLINLVDKQ